MHALFSYYYYRHIGYLELSVGFNVKEGKKDKVIHRK